MKKIDIINELVKRGIVKQTAQSLVNGYRELTPFNYATLFLSTAKNKFKNQFGASYLKYGIYISFMRPEQTILNT